MNQTTVRILMEQYPHGVPARLVRAELGAAGGRTGQARAISSVAFSGPSASKLAIVFREEFTETSSAARDLVIKAVRDGLQRPISDVVLVQCSAHTEIVSLADCSPRVVLVADETTEFVKDAGTAAVYRTDAIAQVLVDREAKKRFWHALKTAWEESQR